ncbi:hypothetical protein [Microbulbifer sp. TYP-18]|uniref:hypothetical protein n=1 Tax=Microbulbifer sp. TYP-18 TaxID=3230024 RepID=UPI0034C6661D
MPHGKFGKKVMRKIATSILFVFTILPSIVFSHSKEDIAREIFINDNAKKEISTLNETFENQRKIFLESYEPSYGINEAHPEILAMQEQLYIDAVASNVFKFDSDTFEESLIADVVSLLTLEELLELRRIYQRPVFKKLESINESMLKTTKEYIEKWKEKNQRSVEEFKARNDKISIKLKELLELRKKDKI